MYSVNIDKLLQMEEKEETAYQDLCNNILKKDMKFKSIAFCGETGVAFKLTALLHRAGNKVLFIDADISTPIFIKKYKLGKDLKGLCDYLLGSEQPDNIICSTNEENFDIIFTGDADNENMLELNEEDFDKLIQLYKNNYDYIILEMGNNTKFLKYCDTSVMVINESDYNPKRAKKEVERLAIKGSVVMGVVINQVS